MIALSFQLPHTLKGSLSWEPRELLSWRLHWPRCPQQLSSHRDFMPGRRIKGKQNRGRQHPYLQPWGCQSVSSFWGGVNLLGLAEKLNTTLYWMTQRLCMVRLTLTRTALRVAAMTKQWTSNPIRVKPRLECKCDNAHEGRKLLFILEWNIIGRV